MIKIRGKLPDERIDLGEMVPWDIEGAESIVHGLMRCFDIEEDTIRQRKTSTGFASIADRIIHIPASLDSPQKFLVALHEIGHIKNSSKTYKFDYLMEYDAEMYAIELGNLFGFIKKRSMDAYIKRAKAYVLSYIERDIKKIKSIPREILDWINNDTLNKKYGSMVENIHGNTQGNISSMLPSS